MSGKGSSRKHGRNLNRAKCKEYKLHDQRGINKRRKLLRHVSGQPHDKIAAEALRSI